MKVSVGSTKGSVLGNTVLEINQDRQYLTLLPPKNNLLSLRQLKFNQPSTKNQAGFQRTEIKHTRKYTFYISTFQLFHFPMQNILEVSH